MCGPLSGLKTLGILSTDSSRASVRCQATALHHRNIHYIHDTLMGATVERIRRAAKLTQAEVAKRVRMSAATISRIEKAESDTAITDIEALLDAIGTEEALEFKTFLSDEWRHLERPPFHHPDRKHLWRADQLLEETQELRAGASASFDKHVLLFEQEIEDAARFLHDDSHDIAFVGEIGVGKTTAICSVADLRVPEDKAKQLMRQMVLEVGAGGTTICEVQVTGGSQYGIRIEPRSDSDLRQDVADFAASLKIRYGDGAHDGEAIGVSREVERAIRNMARLSVSKKERTLDGKRARHDPARELVAQSTPLEIEILRRMDLPSRANRDLWYSNEVTDSPLKWMRSIFSEINNGRNSGFTIPEIIHVILSRPILNHEHVKLRIIDTKGIDQASERADIGRHFDNPRTLVALCSGFKSAPDPTLQSLLQRAQAEGVPDVGERSLVLVLPQPQEARSMKDHDGSLATDDEDGYDIKREQVEAELGRLKLTEVPVVFFNAMSDDPISARTDLVAAIERIRERKAKRIEQLAEVVSRLKSNREEEEVKTVLASAMRRVAVWIKGHDDLGRVSDKLHRSLISSVESAHARSVWASTRRRGKWYSLDYYYQIGRGARTVAAKHVQSRVEALEAIVGNLTEDDNFSHAHDLLEEVLHLVRREVQSLLHTVELTAHTGYETVLKNDASFWASCESRWGLGGGYRSYIALLSDDWFNDHAGINEEINASIVSSWTKIISRVLELIRGVAPEALSDLASKSEL